MKQNAYLDIEFFDDSTYDFYTNNQLAERIHQLTSLDGQAMFLDGDGNWEYKRVKVIGYDLVT